jgi:hypothetical protein
MANTTAGTVWNAPNYLGEIFTASHLQTPVLTMAGGLNGVMQTGNFEFPISQTYAHETAAQPAITETASLTAPTAITYVRSQDKNVTQIFQEQVTLSYAKMSNMNRLSGISTSGQSNVPVNELDWQIAKALEKIARDLEFTLLQGVYQISTDSATANKTRGLNACTGTTVNANSAGLAKPLIQQLLREMFAAGAVFQNPVFIVNAFQKQKLSEIYGYAPTDRNIGGINIKQIETDFGNIGVVLDPFQLASTLLIADMPVVKIVTQPVPNKGNLFYEELSKTGAGEKGQIFGQIGLDHGPAFMHGKITSLATS